MPVKKEAAVVKLTMHQAWRIKRLSEQLWPGEELPLEEAARRLILEYVLWQEGEHQLTPSW